MNDVLPTLAAVGGIITFFTFIGVTWKLMRFIFKVDKALPVLLNIAGQFENNGGSTLKDKIDDICTKTTSLESENRVVLKIAEDSRLVAETNAKIVNELTRVQTEDVQHIKEYLHEKMHDINNSLHTVTMQASLTEARSVRMEQRLDTIIPLITRRNDDARTRENDAE